MGTKICMNTLCGATVSSTWKKGWELKSGQIADLCLNCGSVYEKLAYCDTFHNEETGWRECSLCNKRLHCGCSATMPFIEIQDFGGVWCINCAHSAGCHKNLRDALPLEMPKWNAYASGELHTPHSSNKLDGDSYDDGKLLNLATPSKRIFFGLQMEITNPDEFARKSFENIPQTLMEPPKLTKLSDDWPKIGVKDVHEPQILPSLNISLGTPDSKSVSLALPGGIEEGEKNKQAFIQSMQKPRHILPKPAKPKSSEGDKGLASQKRIARPPAEARLRNQLLPRYWPRYTDQELQKLCEDLKSTIVPLFEKVLSASDASRIGRLVLPKACAEAYFPSINQSEGLPMNVQDVKGNEWTFQFRFWPNNNSRMYVLEGITPCMQAMQVEAGDTVIFSKIDPGGKLVIGSRKASNSFESQDQQTSASHNGVVSEDNFYSDASDSPATVNGYSDPLLSVKGSRVNNVNVLSEQSNILNGDIGWIKNGNLKGKMSKGVLDQLKFCSENKALNIGAKSKRLLMQSEVAVEMRVTWEETQDLLRPPLGVQPNLVVVEEFELEEYDEPPVFGKRTLFTTGLLGGQNQWAQCDKCAKWRKLPWDVLLPPKWSCSDNVWDLRRSACSAPEEISSEGLDRFLRVGKDTKKRKVAERSIPVQNCEPSGLDALANAAVLGDQTREPAVPPTTTRHPRHRPGCSCIVCIQPPSGKGKHESGCTCNVCLTVKRRFKTLMARKKKKQCEREAEIVQQKSQNDQEHHPLEEPGSSSLPSPLEDNLKSEVGQQNALEESESSCKGIIDLNCRPAREDDMQVGVTAGSSMLNLVQAATIPSETNVTHYTNQNKTASLSLANQASSSDPLSVQPQGKKEGENNYNNPKSNLETEPRDEPELRPERENAASATAVEEHGKKQDSI